MLNKATKEQINRETPWGNVESQSELHRELAGRMSDDEWAAEVTDKQVKAHLVRFYHQVLENIDLYSPDSSLSKELVAT